MSEVNPYSAPAASLEAGSRPSALWWVYLVLVTALTLLLLVVFTARGISYVNAASCVIDLACVMGPYFYVRSRPAISETFWRAVLVLLCVKVVVVLTWSVTTISVNSDGSSAGDYRYYIIPLSRQLLIVPLGWALWRYAFASPQVWQGRAAAKMAANNRPH